ncbi:MAG: L,D-transpeptidase [Ktedonobacteraceae bacterium]|nr:L,D-transpeptidase [Ktedonobacteraceae bacterium]
MYATGWSNVRNIPDTAGTLLRALAPAASVTVYGKAEGQAQGSDTTWYRISGKSDAPQYVYGGLLSTQKPSINAKLPGKVIKVSLKRQKLYAYNNGKLVFTALVATGRPELPTPTGTYHIFVKKSPATFYSPWPKGSKYYYDPVHVKYALEFKEGGFFMHDATWRTTFGPGSNVPHTTSDGRTETGSHGCITMTLANAAKLYKWAPLETTVIIY